MAMPPDPSSPEDAGPKEVVARDRPSLPTLNRSYGDEHGGYVSSPTEEHTLQHDQTGEFDYGIEGGQSQNFGADAVGGSGPDTPQEAKVPALPADKRSPEKP